MVPFLDLQAQHESIREEIDSAIQSVLDSREFILGSYVADFERAFADYCNVRHAIAVNSGTSALHLSLLAAGIQPDDEVITVPFTFIASVAAPLYCGAKPILVDIDPRSFTIDADAVRRAITAKTRAILPVHLFGQCADMDPLLQLAGEHGLTVIEDAAQAHGAEYNGRKAGGLGHLGCFSFYPTKNLGACGEGGMVTTNDAELAAKVRLLRNWGQSSKYQHTLLGFNYRLEGLQAAILNVKLRHLDKWTTARRRAAALYDELLQGSSVVSPAVMPYARHVYHTYTIRTRQRDRLQEHLSQAGIQTAVHYPIPAHLQPACQSLGYGPGSFPQSESSAREVLSLPMYPELQEHQIRAVVDCIRSL